MQKRAIIKEMAKRYNMRVFIETGTYLGDMILAMSKLFDELYSVELDAKLYKYARRRLSHKPNIHLFQGDSGDVLPEILPCCRQPALFWLDAHYSGEGTAQGSLNTPIVRELTQILSDGISHNIILVDDARCFNGMDGYPTIEKIQHLVRQHRPEYDVAIENDIIRITPGIPLSRKATNSLRVSADTYTVSQGMK